MIGLIVILNVAAYKFVPLDQLDQRRAALKRSCSEYQLKGTILLSSEGINLFLAGAQDRLRDWLEQLKTDPCFADIHIKESFCDSIPFHRMLVKIKREIIAFGIDGIAPHRATSPKLSAHELKRWLDEGRDVALLDVRNDFEVAVGTFDNAIPVRIDHFRDFENSIDHLPEELRDKPVVMFCTGGIRCEKAGPLMERKGYSQIYQLDGGILKYFEEVGSDHYQGDCFVFDGRVALDPQLQVSGLAQCFACQAILTPDQQKSEQYIVGVSCPRCYRSPDEQLQERISQRHDAIRQLADDLPGCKPHSQCRPIRISESLSGKALLDCLLQIFPQVPQQDWEQAFAEGRIQFKDSSVEPNRVVRNGEQYLHVVNEFLEPAVNGHIEIVWEDNSFIAVNKPAPLPVHPSGRFNHNTLLGLLKRVYAPEILRAPHRLDANTTGLVLICRTRAIAHLMHRQFEARQVDKQYYARCIGHPEEENFSCALPIAVLPGAGRVRTGSETGAEAHTDFQLLEKYPDGTSLLKVVPISGRTNQIRAHLWELGMPVMGDPLYLPNKQLGANEALAIGDPPMCLHASHLSFVHPVTGQPITLNAPRPEWASVSAVTR